MLPILAYHQILHPILEMHSNKCRPFKRQTRATCGCMAAQVKVLVCSLGLLPPRLTPTLSVTTAPLKVVCAHVMTYNESYLYLFYLL